MTTDYNLEYQVQIKMKLQSFLVATVLAQDYVSQNDTDLSLLRMTLYETDTQVSGSASVCFACNAQNMTECESTGQMVQCRKAEIVEGKILSSSVCMTEIRKRDGVVSQVMMGCKDAIACDTQKVKSLICEFKINLAHSNTHFVFS